MTRAFILSTALLALTPFAAQADQPAITTDASYVAAARCLAYADLPQLQSNPEDYAALRTAFAHYDYRSVDAPQSARVAARQVRVSAGGLGSSERSMNQLRQHRADTCARFVQSGLVQAEEATPHA